MYRRRDGPASCDSRRVFLTGVDVLVRPRWQALASISGDPVEPGRPRSSTFQTYQRTSQLAVGDPAGTWPSAIRQGPRHRSGWNPDKVTRTRSGASSTGQS